MEFPGVTLQRWVPSDVLIRAQWKWKRYMRRLRQLVRTRRTVDLWRAELARTDIARENTTIHLRLTRSLGIARKLEKRLVTITRHRPWDKDDLSG